MNGPDNVLNAPDMEELGILYSRQRRYDEAVPIFHAALSIAGKAKSTIYLPVAWYNFACAAAIAGRRNDALHYLQEAVNHGFSYADNIADDSDLQSLHSDPRFDRIVAAARLAAMSSKRSP